MSGANTQVFLARRPDHMPGDDVFGFRQIAVPAIRPGEVLVEAVYVSLDPYMRGAMNGSFVVGEAMSGGVVGRIADGGNSGLRQGAWVQASLPWQSFSAVAADQVRLLDADDAPVSTALGVLGMPGLTAWTGLHNVAGIEPGESVFVSAATGAVGSVAGQIARLHGCRVIGCAGSDEKCAWARDVLGYDGMINHRSASDLATAIAALAPDGVDVDFENVGGPVMQAVIANMNTHGRIALCGMISQYNRLGAEAGPNNLFRLIYGRIRMQGFIVSDYAEEAEPFRRQVGAWVRAGKLHYREDIAEGWTALPQAFRSLLSGDNFGKVLVQVSDDPSRRT
ncbi:MAG: NADP-dependent oxidoreductase [Alphaproteobacteria bacterium]